MKNLEGWLCLIAIVSVCLSPAEEQNRSSQPPEAELRCNINVSCEVPSGRVCEFGFQSFRIKSNEELEYCENPKSEAFKTHYFSKAMDQLCNNTKAEYEKTNACPIQALHDKATFDHSFISIRRWGTTRSLSLHRVHHFVGIESKELTSLINSSTPIPSQLVRRHLAKTPLPTVAKFLSNSRLSLILGISIQNQLKEDELRAMCLSLVQTRKRFLARAIPTGFPELKEVIHSTYELHSKLSFLYNQYEGQSNSSAFTAQLLKMAGQLEQNFEQIVDTIHENEISSSHYFLNSLSIPWRTVHHYIKRVDNGSDICTSAIKAADANHKGGWENYYTQTEKLIFLERRTFEYLRSILGPLYEGLQEEPFLEIVAKVRQLVNNQFSFYKGTGKEGDVFIASLADYVLEPAETKKFHEHFLNQCYFGDAFSTFKTKYRKLVATIAEQSKEKYGKLTPVLENMKEAYLSLSPQKKSMTLVPDELYREYIAAYESLIYQLNETVMVANLDKLSEGICVSGFDKNIHKSVKKFVDSLSIENLSLVESGKSENLNHGNRYFSVSGHDATNFIRSDARLKMWEKAHEVQTETTPRKPEDIAKLKSNWVDQTSALMAQSLQSLKPLNDFLSPFSIASFSAVRTQILVPFRGLVTMAQKRVLHYRHAIGNAVRAIPTEEGAFSGMLQNFRSRFISPDDSEEGGPDFSASTAKIEMHQKALTRILTAFLHSPDYKYGVGPVKTAISKFSSLNASILLENSEKANVEIARGLKQMFHKDSLKQHDQSWNRDLKKIEEKYFKEWIDSINQFHVASRVTGIELRNYLMMAVGVGTSLLVPGSGALMGFGLGVATDATVIAALSTLEAAGGRSSKLIAKDAGSDFLIALLTNATAAKVGHYFHGAEILPMAKEMAERRLGRFVLTTTQSTLTGATTGGVNYFISKPLEFALKHQRIITPKDFSRKELFTAMLFGGSLGLVSGALGYAANEGTIARMDARKNKLKSILMGSDNFPRMVTEPGAANKPAQTLDEMENMLKTLGVLYKRETIETSFGSKEVLTLLPSSKADAPEINKIVAEIQALYGKDAPKVAYSPDMLPSQQALGAYDKNVLYLSLAEINLSGFSIAHAHELMHYMFDLYRARGVDSCFHGRIANAGGNDIGPYAREITFEEFHNWLYDAQNLMGIALNSGLQLEKRYAALRELRARMEFLNRLTNTLNPIVVIGGEGVSIDFLVKHVHEKYYKRIWVENDGTIGLSFDLGGSRSMVVYHTGEHVRSLIKKLARENGTHFNPDEVKLLVRHSILKVRQLLALREKYRKLFSNIDWDKPIARTDLEGLVNQTIKVHQLNELYLKIVKMRLDAKYYDPIGALKGNPSPSRKPPYLPKFILP